MSLEIQSIGTLTPNQPALVFLHEGLGSVSAWRDFPKQLCDRCQLAGLVYSRNGYGQSGLFEAPLDPQFMHHAARVELADLLTDQGVTEPILIGHSDGASTALIYGALVNSELPAAAIRPVAIVAMAPHLFVEPICTESIQALRDSYPTNERLKAGLRRYHRDADLTFRTWTDAWLSAEFAHWNIESLVAQIQCPVLGIQGEQDQYGTLAQVERLSALAPHASHHALADCQHSPHVDQPERVLTLIEAFVRSVRS